VKAGGKKVKEGVKKGATKVKEKGKEVVGKIFEWWKMKKEFKTKDGESHSIFFRRKNKNVKLMVASETEDVATLLKNNIEDPEFDKANTTWIEIKNIMVLGKDQSKKNTINEKSLSQLLVELSVSLGKMKINFEVPLSNVTYSFSGNRANKVIANPLTHRPGNTKGSEPKEGEDPKGYDDQRVTKEEKKYWVRAHLLNAKLHGPGLRWNLVPGTKETNNNMKTEIENPAKNAVLGSKSNVYFYDVSVKYHDESENSNDKYFPESIAIEWGELDEKNAKSNQKSKIFKQDKPPEFRTIKVSINQSSAGRLWKHYTENIPKKDRKIPKRVFKEIIKARREKDNNSFDKVDDVLKVISKKDKEHKTELQQLFYGDEAGKIIFHIDS
jgi:hypothetical protein